MKTPLIISILAMFFHFQTYSNALQISLPFGSKEKIIKVRELPNTSEFQLKDGTYYDIGSLYTKKRFLWLGYSYGEPEYVGYLNSQEKYLPLTTKDLNTIAAQARIQLPLNPEISFFDSYLSRPLLTILVCILGYFGYRYFQKRREGSKNGHEEGLPSWPPNTAQ